MNIELTGADNDKRHYTGKYVKQLKKKNDYEELMGELEVEVLQW